MYVIVAIGLSYLGILRPSAFRPCKLHLREYDNDYFGSLIERLLDS